MVLFLEFPWVNISAADSSPQVVVFESLLEKYDYQKAELVYEENKTSEDKDLFTKKIFFLDCS